MRILGIDCEMVAVEPNHTNSLARVSIVDENYNVLYDKYVRQSSRVLCYRTRVSGIVRADLMGGKLHHNVRRDVINIIRNSLLVGHSIHHDLDALDIDDDLLEDINCIIRDTATYSYFRKVRPSGNTPSLKELAKVFLKKNIQKGHHDSIEDARTVVRLYNRHKHNWEHEIDQNQSDSEEYTDSDDYSSYYYY